MVIDISKVIILVSFAYLIGSIPFGKILGLWLKGEDIQKKGSGNIGFANAVRVFGWRIGAAVLILDIAKGFLPIYIASLFIESQALLLCVSVVPILAHAFPIWLGFKGGKSIATGFGVLLVIAPQMALIGILLYMVTFAFTRQSDVSSLCGTWGIVIFSIALEPALLGYFLLLALFASYTHRTNIIKLKRQYVG